MCAGEIPHVGDFVMCRGWCFEILHADDKKILQVKVERLVGAFEGDSEDDGDVQTGGPLRSFLKRNLGDDEASSDEDVDDQLEQARRENSETAWEVERMVGSTKTKMELTSQAISEMESDI